MLYEFTLQTEKEGFYNITEQVKQSVDESKISSGIAVIHSTHTTAGITINENADPNVVKDILFALDKTFPKRPEFRHAEGNTTAHLKTSFVGNSVTVPIENGKLVLGIWQGIYFCEFDGPRKRKYVVKIISE